MASVIILLEAIASLFSLTSTITGDNALESTIPIVTGYIFNTPDCVLPSNFNNTVVIALNRIGYPSAGFQANATALCKMHVATQNNSTAEAKAENVNLVMQSLQLVVGPIVQLLDNFDIFSAQDGELLKNDIDIFRFSTDPNVVTWDSYTAIISAVNKVLCRPAEWFMGVGGFILILFALIMYIRRRPADRLEWGRVLVRLLGGVFSVLLTFFDIDALRQLFTLEVHNDPDTLTQSPSIVWKFALSNWVLPTYAILVFLINAVDGVLLYLSIRKYRKANSMSENVPERITQLEKNKPRTTSSVTRTSSESGAE